MFVGNSMMKHQMHDTWGFRTHQDSSQSIWMDKS